jgi:hypothetical protein
VRFVLAFLLAVSIVGVVSAQDCGLDTCTPTPSDTPTETPTPSSTPTPTNTPTPTPDIQNVWTLPPPDATLPGTPGTPAPGQPVAFIYSVDSGQYATNLLLFALLVSLWLMFVSYWWRNR